MGKIAISHPSVLSNCRRMKFRYGSYGGLTSVAQAFESADSSCILSSPQGLRLLPVGPPLPD